MLFQSLQSCYSYEVIIFNIFLKSIAKKTYEKITKETKCTTKSLYNIITIFKNEMFTYLPHKVNLSNHFIPGGL
jgi:hypothetical protein